jgi:hypothetical protein
LRPGEKLEGVFVADLRDAIRPQPVNLAADLLQPPGHEGLTALRQGGVDLLKQTEWTFAHRHIPQDDLPIRDLDRRQPTSPIDYCGHRLDGSVQVVALPTGWNHAVVWCEEIGAQLILVFEAAPLTLVVVWIAAASQAGDIEDVWEG